MPPANPKNLGISAAATDLGMGDMLGQQVQSETEDARKKRLAAMQQQGMTGGFAAMDLLGGSSGGRGY